MEVADDSIDVEVPLVPLEAVVTPPEVLLDAAVVESAEQTHRPKVPPVWHTWAPASPSVHAQAMLVPTTHAVALPDAEVPLPDLPEHPPRMHSKATNELLSTLRIMVSPFGIGRVNGSRSCGSASGTHGGPS